MKLLVHNPPRVETSSQSVVSSNSRFVSEALYSCFPESPEPSPSPWSLSGCDTQPDRMFDDGRIPPIAEDQSLPAMFNFDKIPGLAEGCDIDAFLQQDSPVSDFTAASLYSPPQLSAFHDTTSIAESYSLERSDIFSLQPPPMGSPELKPPLPTSTGIRNQGHGDQSTSSRRRRLTPPAKSHKNTYERKRLHTITDGLDMLQGAVWKEKVTKKEERRKRATVLQRAAGYMRLLSAAVDGNVSEDLLTCVQAYAARSPEESDGIEDRTLMLRVLLEAHDVESRQASTPSTVQ